MMLIRFRVRNFLSFREEVEFSMIAGKVKQHPEHIMRKSTKYGVDLLRTSLLYGANASGKSNLVSAIEFAQFMITQGVRPMSLIPRKAFKLDDKLADLPSRFEFEILLNEKIYEYGFELDNKRIQQEWLIEVKPTVEKLIYKRVTTQNDENSIELGIKVGKKDSQLIDFVALGTPTNRLFLQESVERNIKYFSDVYKWFKDVLVVIYPSSHHSLEQIASENADEFGEKLVKYLEMFSTGICGYSLQPINDPKDEFPETLIEELVNGKDETRASVIGPDGERYFVKKEADRLVVDKLFLRHRNVSCDKEYLFEMEEESDGTLRLMDLIPMLFPMKPKKQRVVIIDELDRSLHPSLCYDFIERFLDSTENKQLIVTTHEANLLDLNLVRRDEIWFVEKSQDGASHVYSLEEFAPRYDKDIRKGYMLGRFGAIPMIGQPNI